MYYLIEDSTEVSIHSRFEQVTYCIYYGKRNSYNLKFLINIDKSQTTLPRMYVDNIFEEAKTIVGI